MRLIVCEPDQLSERFGESLSIPADFLANANDASVARKESGRKDINFYNAIQMGQKLKTALRVPPGRLVQSLKGGVSDSSRRFKYVRSFTGHRDGVWHVATSRGSQPILASASADQTCLLWSLDSGCCLAQYNGHSGSVNAVSFNPSSKLPLKCVRAAFMYMMYSEIYASCIIAENEMSAVASIRQPLCRLTGHTGVVIAVEWIAGGEQLITASWDRTANIYDAERGEILNVLSGHDDELNHCSAHLSQKLVVWDLRNMRSAIATGDIFSNHFSELGMQHLQSHRRMVCCATWADDHAVNDLITCGFDKQIIAWKTSMGKE
uniref:WD_REPEATS_REGION domain-containing protein n=1 Tax=Parascaris equorum TaxID=6256 RepID=A0A914RKR9_PAREQ